MKIVLKSQNLVNTQDQYLNPYKLTFTKQIQISNNNKNKSRTSTSSTIADNYKLETRVINGLLIRQRLQHKTNKIKRFQSTNTNSSFFHRENKNELKQPNNSRSKKKENIPL